MHILIYVENQRSQSLQVPTGKFEIDSINLLEKADSTGIVASSPGQKEDRRQESKLRSIDK